MIINKLKKKTICCLCKVDLYNINMKHLILIYILFLSFKLVGNDYILSWLGEVKDTKTIAFPDKSIYKIVNPFGYWEDNKGQYGKINCLGWVKTTNNRETLEVSCEAIDNNNEEFWFVLNRDSEIGAGIGKTTYIAGTGKYKKLINKVCKYAINHAQEGFFYKQQCKT